MCFDFISDISISSKEFVASLFGAVVGGTFSLLATFFAHKNNIKTEENKRIYEEEVLISSIFEEIKAVIEYYKEDIDKTFQSLGKEKWISTYYTITREPFNIYLSNANKIGIIKNERLRLLFIQIHVAITKFIEEMNIYGNIEDENLLIQKSQLMLFIYNDIIKSYYEIKDIISKESKKE